MKKIIFASCAALLLAWPSISNAKTTLAAWTFDNVSLGANASPSPSSGFGTASAIGMANSFNHTNSISNPAIYSIPGSSSGLANCWLINSNGAAPSGGVGWSTNAPIGTQGAKFSSSSAGYYQVSVSFDLYATPDAEANVQVQYTTEGSIWNNATNIISTGSAVVKSNANTNSTVIGTYLTLASGWNNGITVNLSGISGVDNNPNFAIRIVNASTGTNCVDTTGAIYNNTSGFWAYDNVLLQGVSVDTIAGWTFASYGTGGIYASNSGYVENPIAELNFAAPGAGLTNTVIATCIGFNTSYNFAGTIGSTNAPDVLSQAGSSTPNNPFCWRARGAPGNGWNTQSPIGTQGSQYDVSTVNFSNIVINFDLYFTSQGEAKLCVLYTTNGWTNSFTANSLYYAANPNFVVTNNPSDVNNYSPDTVTGTYFYQTVGQNWYNNLVVDLTGVPGVDNNPFFGIRIVNAATGNDCVAFNGFSYNNSSGNNRFANVTFGGQFAGLIPPVVASAPNATVDNSFTNTFTDDPSWRSSISAVYVNGGILTNTAYNTTVPGKLIFTPSQSALFQVSGLDTIVVYAAGYSTVKITQPVAAGVFKALSVAVQPLAPSASSGTLAVNPVLQLTDQYNNTTTNPYANVVVTAAVGGSGGWNLGGATTQAEVNGVITFTNLSATVSGSAAVNGAVIALTVTGYTNSANSSTTTNFNLSTFNIGVPPVNFTPGNLAVLQIDTLSNNTTFSMIEVKPSTASQTTPVNIVPISATAGTNSLRQSSAGSTGRLCLSDDGTLLCFAAFLDGSAATPDETLNLDRAAVAVNYSNLVTVAATYTSVSLGGSQARAACTTNDSTFFVDDKGGLYVGSGPLGAPNVNALNNVAVKTFGGRVYVETQKTANGSPIPVVYALSTDGLASPIPNNLGTDPNATDFYLISTNCGSTYDIMYIVDQDSSSQGVVTKYSWAVGADPLAPGTYGWATNGTFTNATSCDGLLVATNGNGGASIFYTTGTGGTGGNAIIRLTDSAGWNQPIHIISSNLVYTAAKTASIKGLTFTPQKVAYTGELIPPPILVAQSGAKVSSSFSITNIPDDPQWRSSVVGITVNGTTLAPAAYSTTTAGVITFNPSLSALLQTSGNKTIVITANNYSTNSIVQALASGPATQLVITTQPTAPVGNGGPLAHQPVVKVEDQFNNVVTNNVTIVASAVQGTWTLGGTTTLGTTAGVATYTNVTAFSASAVTGATISFVDGGLNLTSSPFNIPAPIRSVLTGATAGSGKFTLSYTNITGLSYSVLATNNLKIPLASWPVIGHPTESPVGSGIYQFTNSTGTNTMFYILRQP